MYDARGDYKHRIIRCRRERLGPFGHRQRLGIFRLQTKYEPEPVQQPSAHRMFGDVGEKRVRTLKRALGFGAHAIHVGRRHAAKRRERDLQRVAFGASGTWPRRVNP